MGEKLSNTNSGAGDEWYGGPHESANQAGALSEPHNHCSSGVALQQWHAYPVSAYPMLWAPIPCWSGSLWVLKLHGAKL